MDKAVWKQQSLGIKIKIQIYQATVLSILLYGAETWTFMYNKLNSFNTKKLRHLLGKKKCEIHNEELYKITKTRAISEIIKEKRMKWAGHVRRMSENRLPKKILFGEIIGGARKRGKPSLTWTKCLLDDCCHRGIGGNGSFWVKESAVRPQPSARGNADIN